MYKHILVPVDLEHTDKLDKALSTGADLAKHYGADLHLVGVTDVTPSTVARNPEEFAEKLAAFAAEEGGRRGVTMHPKAMVSHDPAIEVDDKLKQAAAEIGADLVVMASHVPGMADYVFHSRAGWLASHSDLSVFVVR